MLETFLDWPKKGFQNSMYNMIDRYTLFCTIFNSINQSQLVKSEDDCQPVILDTDLIQINHAEKLPESNYTDIIERQIKMQKN